jgi:hypothetical protein
MMDRQHGGEPRDLAREALCAVRRDPRDLGALDRLMRRVLADDEPSAVAATGALFAGLVEPLCD